MEELLDRVENSAKRRPVFLLVLCILTFAGSALLLTGSWIQYDSAVRTMQMMKGLFRSMPGMGSDNDRFYGYLQWQIIHSLVQIAAAVLTTLGAVFMLRLRKRGFFVYVVGQLASMGITLWFCGITIGPHVTAFELLVLALVVLLPGGFIVLYAFNYKHLR